MKDARKGGPNGSEGLLPDGFREAQGTAMTQQVCLPHREVHKWSQSVRDILSPSLFWLAAIVAGLIAVAAFAGVLKNSLIVPHIAAGRTGYSTQTGERSFIRLEDNSTVAMNTATRIAVDSAGNRQRLYLLAGEAVIQPGRTSRHLQVTIGDLDVDGQGATFDIHRREFLTQVTVIDGQIMLRCACFNSMARPEGNHLPHPISDGGRPDTAIILTANEQLDIDREDDTIHFHRRALTSQDREALIAWEEGHLIFRGQALDEAVAEFNRYNRCQLIIDDESIRRLRIGGVFSTGDVDSFILALHNALGLRPESLDSHQPDHDFIRLVRDVRYTGALWRSNKNEIDTKTKIGATCRRDLE
jgi:transmembrane sensor